MDTWLLALEQTSLAAYLRTARWGYAAVNAAHIFGVALLVGAILPLDLKLMGFWRGIERMALARVLVPVAASGLFIAILTGMMLFSVRAQEYAALSILWLKLSLVAVGALSAIAVHVRYGIWLGRATPNALVPAGVISFVAWTSALICGRLIAFVG